MRNDINIIKNELIEQTNEKKQRELERKQQKQFNNFKKLCVSLINTTIFNSMNNGASLHNIYLQRNSIINSILQDIKTKTIELEDPDKWNGETITTKQYPYPDYEIIEILSMAFDSEYSKAEKRQKKEHLIIKQELKKRLYDYFIATFESGKMNHVSLHYVYNNLRDNYYKQISINDIAYNEHEADIINDIYYTILNEAKKGYDLNKPKQQKQIKKQKLAIPWRLIGYKTALKKLWKL